MDDLSIPEFLLRTQFGEQPKLVARSKKQKKIAYPKDGYSCKGMRQSARDRHRTKLRRKADKMRKR